MRILLDIVRQSWSTLEENASDGDIHLHIDAAVLLWSTMMLSVVGIVSACCPQSKPRASTRSKRYGTNNQTLRLSS
jgi:hypothetical protein